MIVDGAGGVVDCGYYGVAPSSPTYIYRVAHYACVCLPHPSLTPPPKTKQKIKTNTQAMWPALHALVPSLPAPAPGAAERPELEPLTVACRIERAGAAPSNEPPMGNGDGNGHGGGGGSGRGGGDGGEEEDEEEGLGLGLDDVPGFYLRPAGARGGGLRPLHARLLVNERLTPPEWFQETRHYAWDVAGGLEGEGGEGVYRAGDVAYVYPENPPESVAACLALLGLAEGDVCVLSPVGGEGGGEGVGGGMGMDLPGRCTAGRLVRR